MVRYQRYRICSTEIILAFGLIWVLLKTKVVGAYSLIYFGIDCVEKF